MNDSSRLCFVIMPFATEGPSAKVWSAVICETVFAPDSSLSKRYRCVRADEILGSRPIMEDVRQYIAEADLVIADLTASNANVYYELGIAQELNKPCVIIAHEDEKIPFDVSHLRYIRYTTETAGLSKLAVELEATIDVMLKEDLERDFGIERIMKLERERVALTKRREQLQLEYISTPDFVAAQYGDIAKVGLLRLHPGRELTHIGEPFQGSYYSFLKDTHEYGRGSDISFRDGYLQVGFAGWDYGYFLELGDVPFSNLMDCGAEPPNWLDRQLAEAWRYLFEHVPPTDEDTVRANQAGAHNLTVGEAVLKDRCTPTVRHSYLLRSISYRDWDILIAFQVAAQLPDRSLVLAWRLVKTFPVPKG